MWEDSLSHKRAPSGSNLPSPTRLKNKVQKTDISVLTKVRGKIVRPPSPWTARSGFHRQTAQIQGHMAHKQAIKHCSHNHTYLHAPTRSPVMGAQSRTSPQMLGLCNRPPNNQEMRGCKSKSIYWVASILGSCTHRWRPQSTSLFFFYTRVGRVQRRLCAKWAVCKMGHAHSGPCIERVWPVSHKTKSLKKWSSLCPDSLVRTLHSSLEFCSISNL